MTPVIRPRTLSATLLAVAALHTPAFAGSVDVVWLDGFENGCGNLIHSDAFPSPDASPWPSPWTVAGNAAVADIQQSRARLRPNPTGYSLARMAGDVDHRNAELRFVLRMEDVTTQGVGFYLRQNGGYLQQSATHGQGYAVFVEGTFRGLPGVGVWKEEDGVEIQLHHGPAPSPALVNGTDYRVRFQVLQTAPTTTRVRAKLWIDGNVEPAAWHSTFDDTTAVLQNLSGGLAVDSWSVRQNPNPITAHTFVDSIELISMCGP